MRTLFSKKGTHKIGGHATKKIINNFCKLYPCYNNYYGFILDTRLVNNIVLSNSLLDKSPTI